MGKPTTKNKTRRTSKEKERAKRIPGSRLELLPYQVVLRPLVTEKGMHRSTRHKQYAFEVSRLADKLQIRSAIEELFGVKVTKVCTQHRRGKPRRHRFRWGQTRDWKKAIVTLHPESKGIDFF